MKGGCILNMEIRIATKADLPAIYNIIKGAQAFLKSSGVNQWQDGYPNESTIMADISEGLNYVCCYGERIVGTIVVIFDGEVTYNKIHEGDWLTNDDYATIHRLAIDEKLRGSGLASKMISFVEGMSLDRGVRSIRIDTHRDNIPMQKMLSKNGFTYCGIIYLASGDERLAFEKILS